MANKYISQSREEYSRVYPRFGGVDFSSDPADVDVTRFAYLKNMWRDYKSEQGGAVETVPGYREVFRGDGCDNVGRLGRVRGLHPFRGEDGRTLIAVDYYDKMRVYDPSIEYTVREDTENLGPPEAVEDYYDESRWTLPERDAPDSKSVGWHGGIAIVDGKRYRVIRDGAKDINEEYEPYVPITYADGKPYEQRNMLTDKFIHKYNLLNLDDYETEFEIHPEYEALYEFSFHFKSGTATIKGFKEGSFKESVVIPETIIAFGQVLTVTRVNSGAFRGTEIKKVFIPKSVKEVGESAFLRCKNLETVMFDPGLEKEGSDLSYVALGAFSYCSNLKNIFLPTKVNTGKVIFGFEAFSRCGAEYAVLPQGAEFCRYHLEEEDFDDDGTPPFEGVKKIFKNGDISFAEFAEEAFLDNFDGEIYDYTVESESVCFDDEGDRRDNDTYEYGGSSVYVCGDVSVNGSQITLGPAVGSALYYDGSSGKYKLLARYENYVESNNNGAPKITAEHLYGFTLYEMTKSVDRYDGILIDGIRISEMGCTSYLEQNAEGYIGRVLIGCDIPDVLRGRVLTIEGTAESSKFTLIEGHNDAINGNAFYKGTAKEAIDGCTLCAAFDGRIFLSGNPKLPNTVFYTHRDLTGANNPTYFGVLNFFNDGVGNEPITSLMATSSTLCVLKGDTQNEGSIYYHTGADTGEDLLPRIYPSTQGAAGLGCLGASCNFLDDPVFISRQGLEAVGKEQTNLERSFEHRSYNVDAKLCREDLKSAKLAEWQGYLVIAFDDRMYLADSRQRFTHPNGPMNYEWFYVEGVNGYAMAYESDVYNYNGKTYLDEIWKTASQDFMFEGYAASTLRVEDGSGYYIPVVIDAEEREINDVHTLCPIPCFHGEKYIGKLAGVFNYGQSVGSYTFTPCFFNGEKRAKRTFKITAVCSVDDKLYFGTEGGCVYCFNTDMRGENGKIPEKYYSFDGVRYESACALKADNCDIPGYTKKTSRGSFVLRTKPFKHSRIKARGRADRGELSTWREIAASTSSDLDFNATAFDAFSFGGSDARVCIVRENFRRWYEKQLYFYTDGFCEPFGIYSASFRYTVQGKLKI